MLEVADRVTVLRGGRNAGEARLRPIPGGPLAEGAADAAALARLMVGREVALQERQEATQEATAPGAAALSMRSFPSRTWERGERFAKLSFAS